MRTISDESKQVDITGMLVGVFSDGQPFLVRVEGQEFLPVCSSVEKLSEIVEFSGGIDAEVKAKQITDQTEFLVSVCGTRIMIDPYITKDRNTRFTELLYMVESEK